MLGSQEYIDKKEQLEKEYEEHILEIGKYYQEKFNQEIERSKILRLNGWSLYLNKHQNDFVPNAPDFIKYLIQDHMNNEQIENFVLGLFEESNAFLHITPYAIYTSAKEKAPATIKIINHILSNIIYGITQMFRFEDYLEPRMLEIINKGFFQANIELNKNIDSSNNNA